MRRVVLLAVLLVAAPAAGSSFDLAAQASGALSGRVRDAATGEPVAGALVTIDDGRRGAVTDSSGSYRVREVRSGTHLVLVRLIGFRPFRRDSVEVQGGETTILDIALDRQAIELAPLTVQAADPVLDPLATATEQTITARDLRELPVSSLEEALALSAGAVGESYRGGRLGQEAFIVDGLGLKNQLDASTGNLGVAIPPDILTEASLVTNGFSARYGQALSGLVNVVTKDGGDEWAGRIAYETDRPFGGGWDLGLDRVVVQGDGPLIGKIRALGVLDASARLDADPVNAPRPENPLDPRFDRPAMLPHNGGEQLSYGGKLTIPLASRQTLRLFGLRTIDQRQLYDPLFKYDPAGGPARRTTGTLASAHLQHASGPQASLPVVADLRFGWFQRDFTRGTLVEEPDYKFGAFSGERWHFVGEDLARAQDTAAAAAAIAGLHRPELSYETPWGVPAFFYAGGSRGELAWNRFSELRSQLDVNVGIGQTADLFVGGELIRQRVRTFQRALGYLPVGDSVPPATASNFEPLAAALYAETQFRLADLGITAGLRYDRFDPRGALPLADSVTPAGARGKLNPRIGVSTVVQGATIVASVGRFSQAPDYQYLVDAAFDDTTRTGRFRQGNPNLGFESAWQYELSARVRVTPVVAMRVGAYLKRLEDLVSTVPLGTSFDSSAFGNLDLGTVKGGEILVERELRDGWGLRVSYSLQQAMATSTNAFLLRRAIRIDPLTHDTIIPAKVEFPLDYDRRHGLTAIFQSRIADSVGPQLFGTRPLAGLELAFIGRLASGLPFSRVASGVDSLVGEPNGSRLPSSTTLDLLIRRPFMLFGRRGSVYLDGRNILNRRNVVAVRRDTGRPELDDDGITGLAEQAYAAHPEPIPYESPRYRDYADTDGNGYIEGREELMPLYEAAARDYAQPIFAYGAPRMVRLGLEMLF